MGVFYYITQVSVYSYVPISSVNDMPAGAYIKHSPDGDDTKHDSAVPTAIVPLGHVVATVIYDESTAIYPDGQLVLGAAAYDSIGIQDNININRFIKAPFFSQINFEISHFEKCCLFKRS